MLKKLRLERFKSFKDAELTLGPFTVLIGSNASGKSNIRDAFRFLHGVSRGYSIAEVFGGKYGEGGQKVWQEIRGGTQEAAFSGAETFALDVCFNFSNPNSDLYDTRYLIEVSPKPGGIAHVVREHLHYRGTKLFDSHAPEDPIEQFDDEHLRVKLLRGGKHRKAHVEDFVSSRPVLSQIVDRIDDRERTDQNAKLIKRIAKTVIAQLGSMRFLDPAPEAMRLASLPGQVVLGDRGENLSSVLQAICANEESKNSLVEWVGALTPMDAKDFKFTPDQQGRVLLTLVEENNRETTAYSASDGTLRFLTMLAALQGPQNAQFYFFEELDNGIYPTRLHLLLQLIEQKTAKGKTQVVASTHSPLVLGLLHENSLEHVHFVYRLPDRSHSEAKRIYDLPEAKRLISEGKTIRLMQSGWFDNAVRFTQSAEASK